ncbi:Ankyrin-2 [Eumeta japonica]|uniref:Ankyrin-2 n=1 Tax=Eumeta variegata TaxID=151549 RepID=A0A4C1TFG4_EUMVA|nr:Ankyrin-2 [Eumeta japonica]
MCIEFYCSDFDVLPSIEPNTAFLRAARAGQLDTVVELLDSGAVKDINTCNSNGLNALHLAAKDGHITVVEELLKRGATVDSATKKKFTALRHQINPILEVVNECKHDAPALGPASRLNDFEFWGVLPPLTACVGVSYIKRRASPHLSKGVLKNFIFRQKLFFGFDLSAPPAFRRLQRPLVSPPGSTLL